MDLNDRGWLQKYNFGVPSVFDVCVILFIVILPLVKVKTLNHEMVRKIFFVHGTIALLIVSLAIRRRRTFRSLPLALLALVGLVNVFRFSTGTKYTGVFAESWINFCLLNEGYIYILFAVLLMKLVVENAKETGWYCLAATGVLIGFVYWVVLDNRYQGYTGWSMTPIFAALLALFLMACRAKKWKLVLPSTALASLVAVLKWRHVWMKIVSRPDFYHATFNRIRSSKFWLGHGHPHILNAKDGFVTPEHKEFTYVLTRWGRGWRQNDFLEFGEYQGILALALVVWFFLWLFLRKQRMGLTYFYALTGVLMCLFQRTMYFPVKGGIIIILISLLVVKQLKEREGGQNGKSNRTRYSQTPGIWWWKVWGKQAGR